MDTRKFLYLFAFTACFGLNAYSQVKAYFNYAIFYAPNKGSYVETYLEVAGSSVIFKKQKLKYEAKIKVEINFTQGGNSVKTKTYELLSPELTDTLAKTNFKDLQRYLLNAGTYQTEITISDANNPQQKPEKSTLTVVIPTPTDSIYVSDIELVDYFEKSTAQTTFTKSGYEVVPIPFTYFPEKVTTLSFYAEGYNTLKQLGADSKFLFIYYIESAEMKEMVMGYHVFAKRKSEEIVPLFGQFDIANLASGNYNLVIEIRNSNNELKAKKKFAFMRNAPQVKISLDNLSSVDTAGTFITQVSNPDTLRLFIGCLWPISTTSERDWQNNQMQNNDVKKMQQYIYAFWENRNPKNPKLAWATYMKEVRQVNKVYPCGGQPGFMSDRGRVYLQYGAPSAAQQVSTEPDSYPYEIWQYYRLQNTSTGTYQTNKKFVFYNPTLDGKCYTLLHSDARGEIRDDRWQIKLKQRDNQIFDFDQTKPQGSMGDGASDLFNNPR
ncbi:MAG: GWxTD domain-containing protein [Bacteroidia bacterium]